MIGALRPRRSRGGRAEALTLGEQRCSESALPPDPEKAPGRSVSTQQHPSLVESSRLPLGSECRHRPKDALPLLSILFPFLDLLPPPDPTSGKPGEVERGSKHPFGTPITLS